MTVRILVKRLNSSSQEELALPRYTTAGAAGMDVEAVLEEDVELAPLQRALIPTGLAFAIPDGYEMQVRPRSGLAVQHGVTILNSPGTIDSDYRGEVRICLVNLGEQPFTIHNGDRIGQLVVAAVVRAELCEVEMLEETERGAGGFGHTGI